jgi:hypothetical protein
MSGEETSPPTIQQIPNVLSIDDLLADQSALLSKENGDRATVESIGTQSVFGLKPKLVEWALKGFPSAYPILELNVSPPSLCSDSVARNLYDYIQFLTSKTIEDHVAILQGNLQGMVVSFANMNGVTTLVVSKS